MAAVYVNVGTTIDKALTKLTGGLPRPQFVTWFNEIVQDILRQPREWKFLDDPLTIAVSNNTVTLPDTVSELYAIEVGDFFLTPKDQLSDEEAHKIDQVPTVLLEDSFTRIVQGYTLSANGKVITFHPAVTAATADVIAAKDIATDYADLADTIFPYAFVNLFIAGLRMHYYDLVKDGRYTKESMLYQMEMSKAKAWDNRRKPLPKFNRRGYVRGVV